MYYTYTWSLVIAKDLFSEFRNAGPIMNPALAAKYRRAVLEPGSSMPAMEMMRAFLGRQTRFEAFADWLGETAG